MRIEINRERSNERSRERNNKGNRDRKNNERFNERFNEMSKRALFGVFKPHRKPTVEGNVAREHVGGQRYLLQM
jgi:hypothetical protein